MTKRPHARPKSEIQSYSPLVHFATLAFMTIVALLFTGFMVGLGIELAGALVSR